MRIRLQMSVVIPADPQCLRRDSLAEEDARDQLVQLGSLAPGLEILFQVAILAQDNGVRVDFAIDTILRLFADDLDVHDCSEQIPLGFPLDEGHNWTRWRRSIDRMRRATSSVLRDMELGSNVVLPSLAGSECGFEGLVISGGRRAIEPPHLEERFQSFAETPVGYLAQKQVAQNAGPHRRRHFRFVGCSREMDAHSEVRRSPILRRLACLRPSRLGARRFRQGDGGASPREAGPRCTTERRGQPDG